jgi:hypothetical protein
MFLGVKVTDRSFLNVTVTSSNVTEIMKWWVKVFGFGGFFAEFGGNPANFAGSRLGE